MDDLEEINYHKLVRWLFSDITVFARVTSGLVLRPYQVEVARRIVDSVMNNRGDSIVVIFPRQSGKNELQAQIETFLLVTFQIDGAEMVKISPTWKPQSLNAMSRLERILRRNRLTYHYWQKESGYIYRIFEARIAFLSGAPETNIVGATANRLLEVDEAQDVQIDKYDKEIAPMAASTNATRVFWGTAWTSKTLLARELRAAREAERGDGRQRAFVLDAEQVAAQVPAYGKFVREQVTRLGRDHPLVRTQFYSEEIDMQTGMFPARRQALMVGSHPALTRPEPGRLYAMLLDVAGEDENRTGRPDYSDQQMILPFAEGQLADDLTSLAHSRRDSTALTIVEVGLETLADELVKAPTYRVVYRQEWQGARHTHLYAQITALAAGWGVRKLVVDATGVGAGLASFLERALPGRVLPFVFSQSSKSALGWDFLGIIETGRYREYSPPDRLQVRFWQQVAHCEFSVQDGPGRLARWGVPDGLREPQSGELVHDDLLLSAALVGVLDRQEWSLPGETVVIRRRDPLAEMDVGF